jgi:hypothetical protein
MGYISMTKENCEIINKYAVDNNLELIQLNLGCGGRPIKNWINIDNYDYEKNEILKAVGQNLNKEKIQLSQ